jgi:hypothetical protein
MNSADQLEQANLIATIASTLDSEKNEFPDDAQVIARICVENLHELAYKLAGNGVYKIYS